MKAIETTTPRLKTVCQDCGMELEGWSQKHDIVDCIDFRFLTHPAPRAAEESTPYAEIGAIKILVSRVRMLENEEQERRAGQEAHDG
jgi:hypothetical protein